MSELKNNPPMSNEDILIGNYFANCSTKELETLWNRLKVFYANGYIAEDSPLKPFQVRYLQESECGLGLIVMEKDLLRTMAVRLSLLLSKEVNNEI